MEDMGKGLSKKNDYQYCQKDINRVKEGIKIIDEVWNKYLEHINDLIASAKINDQDAPKIQGMIKCLIKHWQDFKEAWNFEYPKPENHCLFDRNPNQYYVDKQKSLDCFAQKLTELHHAVKDAAYPGWFERLYQFIKTSLLKLYNCLFAGPRNLSSENVYIVAAKYGYAPTMSSYTPTRHNYFICQEKLRDNIALLQEDLAPIEKWQKNSLKAAIYDSASLKRV
ncbi:hypothetical protein [Rickettsiella endosymbiont of Aleochara curtula]|uniref:hypothetical protein n=1 Tax=Rickettsiella endosymbiont of Aleochara curtula TaxID=3077936 RepID=UPI00313ED74E